jgi:hypothetical protein
MGTSHRGDVPGVPGCGKPVIHRGPDTAALDLRLARPMMASDQQQDPVPARDRLFEPAIDRRPGVVEVHAVEVEHPVGLDRAAAQLLVPTAVEGLINDRCRLPPRCLSRLWSRVSWGWRVRDRCLPRRGNIRRFHLSGQRANGGRHPRPQLGLVRAERAHARPRPSAPGSALRRSPTFRRPLQPLRDQRPRTCRTGSVP